MWDDEARHFAVVKNDQGQYSLWPLDMDLPAGWERTGVTGVKKDCLAHIENVWTDMRPRSLVESRPA